jgi:hypothetical protein
MVDHMNTHTDTTHYNYGGNFYYNILASGFCGANAGNFTNALNEVSCNSCLAEVAQGRAWCAK